MLKVSINAVPSLIDLATKSKSNLLIVGNPGVGKSAVIGSLAEDNVTKVVQFTGSSTYEESINGIPYRDAADNLQKYLEPGWLKDIWDFSEANPDGRVILFIDEFNTAEPQVLKTFLSILTERKVPTQKRALPANTVIVAAMNPCNQNNGEELIRPLASRFLTVEVNSTLESFRDYIAGKPSTEGVIEVADQQSEIAEQLKLGLLDQLSKDDWNKFVDGEYHEINPRSFSYFLEALSWVKDQKKACPSLSQGFLGVTLRMPEDIEAEKTKRAEKIEEGSDFYSEAELEELSDDDLKAYFEKISAINSVLGGGSKLLACRMACRRVMSSRGL